MKNFILEQWLWIKTTTLGRFIYALIFTVLFQFSAEIFKSDILGYIGLVFFLYVLYVFIKMLIYALVINPMRGFINWLKKINNK